MAVTPVFSKCPYKSSIALIVLSRSRNLARDYLSNSSIDVPGDSRAGEDEESTALSISLSSLDTCSRRRGWSRLTDLPAGIGGRQLFTPSCIAAY